MAASSGKPALSAATVGTEPERVTRCSLPDGAAAAGKGAGAARRKASAALVEAVGGCTGYEEGGDFLRLSAIASASTTRSALRRDTNSGALQGAAIGKVCRRAPVSASRSSIAHRRRMMRSLPSQRRGERHCAEE
jgi:hypothetical protein